MKLLAVVLAPACACTIVPGPAAGPAACDGHPGLHVVVDLSATQCQGISPDGADWALNASLSGGALDKQRAVHVRALFDPRRIDYLFTWPAGTTDRFEGQITWYGTGDAQTTGSAHTTYEVHVDECETVELSASCTSGTDAGI